MSAVSAFALPVMEPILAPQARTRATTQTRVRSANKKSLRVRMPGNLPMGLGAPPLRMKNLLESKP